ncbi:polyisoprenoid-binding protein YceI [Mycobacterium frederiksbergense]|uniref:Polyisoprenoid-binding protein YceI n=1 Tax=Mycolicibacterium frederiksbergense TaxID=117567 RepID=A0ABT6L0X6_9MYCO|nr:YceI family protein [Mycolicibacterium frederiksbergense]MDH6196603.1 polyisoprenoid-binding protein YceI [Mycolicibacterium frederiksbergense]
MTDILTTSAGNWTLVPDRSRLTFQNKTMWGLSTVTGKFTEFAGNGRADGGVSGRVVVAAASVQTGIGRRDRHLRSAEFFDVGDHPDITAEVTGVASPVEDDEVLLTTILTIRGVSRTLELPVGVQVLDDGALQLSGRYWVERDEFGVSGNLLGMVGPTTMLSGDLVFVRA